MFDYKEILRHYSEYFYYFSFTPIDDIILFEMYCPTTVKEYDESRAYLLKLYNDSSFNFNYCMYYNNNIPIDFKYDPYQKIKDDKKSGIMSITIRFNKEISEQMRKDGFYK